MSVAKYPTYKESGIPWIGSLPTHWDTVPYKHLVDIQNGADHKHIEQAEGYPVIGSGGVFAYASEFMYEGDSVLLGRKGTVDKPLFVSGRFWTVDTMYWTKIAHDANPRFAYYTALTIPFDYYSTNTALPSMTKSVLHAHLIARPPAAEQAAIAAFLDRETAKIDALVEEQRRLVELLHEELKCLVLTARFAEGTRELRLGNAANVMARPVVQKEGEAYRPLGMYNRGRGIFHKDPREMADMGDSDFYWVRSGDLVISGQFAWEGAVGLAGEEEDGCVVSHRYPVLRAKDAVALTEYLFALLLTKHGDFVLNESSWGAAGRNRPLNLGLLLKERIWVPNMQTQMKVAHAVHQSKRLAAEIEIQRDLLHERRSALISAAVTGKIDVRGLVP